MQEEVLTHSLKWAFWFSDFSKDHRGPLHKSQGRMLIVVQRACLGWRGAGKPKDGGCAGGGDAGTFPWVMVPSLGEGVPEAGADAWVTAACLRLFLPPRGF